MAEREAELFLLEAWVADNPGSRLFLKLAQAYRQAGRLEDAAAVLERGLVMHPAMVEARQLLAELLRAMGDDEGALNQLMAAAAELCRHTQVFNGLAELWEAKGQGAQARKAREVGRALSQDLGLRLPRPAAAAPAGLPPQEPPPSSSLPPQARAALLKRLQALERAARQRMRD